MNEMMRHRIADAEFVAAIADIETRDGMILYPEGSKPVRAVFVAFAPTRNRQPGAIYQVAGRDRYALIVLDYLTRRPHILAWVTKEEIERNAAREHARRTRRHRPRLSPRYRGPELPRAA